MGLGTEVPNGVKGQSAVREFGRLSEVEAKCFSEQFLTISCKYSDLMGERQKRKTIFLLCIRTIRKKI